ncbi:MAG: nucleoside-diphosphate kinase [Chitinophagales bacterium]|jgi:nucleoside-diphosphate kinase|nr:nucleoside-diphosphate kinase [Chitinophagales bacterium]
MTNQTYTMIKPDAVANKHTGAIIDRIIKAGYQIKAMKYMKMDEALAKKFYEIHKERPFYMELVGFMTSGPIVAILLEKENAVEDFRKFIGATNPANAEVGTIRKDFAENIERNAIHGSDSDENAALEASIIFAPNEIV